jgi:hypothetical protein
MNTFKIVRGQILANTSSIIARWILRQKFKANRLVARRKAKLVARGNE